MPQSLSKVIVHIVFSTKNHNPWLSDSGIRSELFAYIAVLLKNEVDSSAIIINGVEDHIHILCLLSRKFAIMDVIKKVKTESSKWAKKQGEKYRDFHWQSGYGVFSVSQSKVEHVKRYISNQEEHHKIISFQDEFRALCQKHGIAIDEQYVWD